MLLYEYNERKIMDIKNIQQRLNNFAVDRDWVQYHTPKNLAMALSVEAAELLEIFQWVHTGVAGELTGEALDNVEEEMADVMIYLLRMADVMGVDLEVGIISKMDANEKRYSVDKCKGGFKKIDK